MLRAGDRETVDESTAFRTSSLNGDTESVTDAPDLTRCPLCGGRGSADDVYVHLQTGHRKSAVCEALLEVTEE